MDNQFNNIVDNLKERNSQNDNRKTALIDQRNTIKGLDSVQRAVLESMKVLIRVLTTENLNVSVTNQQESIETPDAITGAEMVQSAVKDLQWTLANKSVDLEPISGQLGAVLDALGKLPTEYPSFPEMPSEMAVNNLGSVIDELKNLNDKISQLEIAPQITVSPPEVKVEAPVVNVKIEKELKNLEKTLSNLKPIDNTEEAKFMHEALMLQMGLVEKAIKDIVIPVPNNKPVYVDATGKGTPVTLTSNGSVPISSLSLTERYDYDDTTTIYVGQASVGTTDSSTGWTIFKYDLTDSNNASGKIATDVSWSNRASGSYA